MSGYDRRPSARNRDTSGPAPAAGWLLVLARQLQQQISRVPVSVVGEAPQLVDIAAFAGEFHQNVDGVAAAGRGEATQLVEVPPLSGQLDELGRRVAVSS